MFPVYTYEEGMDFPTTGQYYVVASNGVFFFKDTGVVKGLVPVPCVPFLDKLPLGELVYDMPMIPEKFVWQMKNFFKEVVKRRRAESMVILWYSHEEKHYRLEVPNQAVSHSGIRYQKIAESQTEGMEGYVRVGTVHSHCDFQAFHSNVDENDEKIFDGLHVTFGHNDKVNFTISSSVVMLGMRQEIDSMHILDGIRLTGSIGNGLRYRTYQLNSEPEDSWVEEVDSWMEAVH